MIELEIGCGTSCARRRCGSRNSPRVRHGRL